MESALVLWEHQVVVGDVRGLEFLDPLQKVVELSGHEHLMFLLDLRGFLSFI